ncbi:cytidylate kinase-like family protein [[Clostridium] spiroforme]|nr:cytidylate kinase-like family protein [Thomasclavelia spiroformis]
MTHKIITITREYGSGGRLIAKKVAEKLNIAFYDNELIDECARQLGIDIDTIRKAAQEKTSSFAYSLNTGPLVLPINDQVYATQAKIIKNLATKEDCIIVNGCANYILEEHPNVLRVFVHAPLQSRIRRVEEDYKEQHDNTKKYVMKRDKQRKNYYNYYTTNTWANVKDYDLCINSDMGMDEIASLIAEVYKGGNLWTEE